MSKRVDELKKNTQVRLYKEEIEIYQKELSKIPWYTIDKKKREYRNQLKEGIKSVKNLLESLN